MSQGTPKVKFNVTNRNLRRMVIVTDGVPAIIGTVATSALVGKGISVMSPEDASAKGFTEQAEPFLYGKIVQFYNEVGGNMKLWLMGVEETMTMTQMVTASNADGLKKLLAAANGEITLVGVCRNPASGYDPGEGFLDEDVEDALLACKPLAEYQQTINRPIRLLIEGRVADQDKVPFAPNTAQNGFAGVVLGNDIDDGSAAIGSALARLCKFPAHIKAGSGENGPLALTDAYIGQKAVAAGEEVDEFWYPEELDSLSNKGYFMLTTREGVAGYFFGVDYMATTDDFRIMVHGRLIDKAQRVATQVETANLETSVRVTAQGKIDPLDAAYNEERLRTAILSAMNGQISDAQVVIPTDQDIIASSNQEMQVSILPLGYRSWITITLGLTSSIEQ